MAMQIKLIVVVVVVAEAFGSVHTTPEEFENVALSLRSGLPR